MNHAICTGPLPAAGLSRRGFLNRFGMGLGGIALANLINPASVFAAAATGNKDLGILNGQYPFPAQSQTRHLSFHGRRTVAARDVRLQAAAQSTQRRAIAGFRAPGSTPHRHVGQSIVIAAGRLAVWVQAIRQKRRVGLRSVAAHGEGGGRFVHRALDVHRGHQS